MRRIVPAVVLIVVDLVLVVLAIALAGGPRLDDIMTPIALPYLVVGGLIIGRDPRNAIGWVLALDGVLFSGLLGVVSAYSGRALRSGDPAAPVAAWVESWIWLPGVAITASFLPLLFPDGRIPSPRWRVAAWLGFVSLIAGLISAMFRPGPLEEHPDVSNPFGIEGPFGELVQTIGWVAYAGILLAAALGVASLAARYRQGSPAERAQLKWFAFAAAIFGAVMIANAVRGPWDDLSNLTFVTSFTLLPIAIGFAILRYRLYDIDLLIKRTAVYGATTAAILITFFGGLVALQALLRPLTAGSEVGIAASTLVSFALFQPIRRRVQDAIDRRFDRARYDAARTLDTFAERLRDEVQLEELRSDLIGAVRHTMGPSHASLWLRERSW